jgi:hypothetical protein
MVTDLKAREIGLIQLQEDGSICQIGLTVEQSKLLQIFLSKLSEQSKLVKMPAKYNLIFKTLTK